MAPWTHTHKHTHTHTHLGMVNQAERHGSVVAYGVVIRQSWTVSQDNRAQATFLSVV